MKLHLVCDGTLHGSYVKDDRGSVLGRAVEIEQHGYGREVEFSFAPEFPIQHLYFTMQARGHTIRAEIDLVEEFDHEVIERQYQERPEPSSYTTVVYAHS